MTSNSEKSLIDSYASFPRGAQELSAATLAQNVVACLEQAKAASGKSSRELAALLGISEGAVSQVLNSDGNIRIATLARYLRALGFEPRLSAEPVDGGESLPAAPRRARTRRASHSEATSAPRVERMSVSVSRCSVTDGDVVAPALSVLLVMPDEASSVTRAAPKGHQESPKDWHVLEPPSWLAPLAAKNAKKAASKSGEDSADASEGRAMGAN
ncbi:helix-turn-helix domain-containing protein [Streptomyces shenzhenensis]|uniref:helix-turn-helix domain-containing protein n=1 Tax=Streptomyces shenzhenensis TaxID=943815 RepID=UPI0036C397BD